MRKVLKWIGTILAGLVGLIILALGVIYFITEAQLNKTYPVSVKPVAIPTGDPAAIERGRHQPQLYRCGLGAGYPARAWSG